MIEIQNKSIIFNSIKYDINSEISLNGQTMTSGINNTSALLANDLIPVIPLMPPKGILHCMNVLYKKK